MTTQFPHQRPSVRQWFALFGCAVLLWSGCSSRGQLELLEAEIRQHKDSYRSVEAKNAQLESQLAAARRETELVRSQVASNGGQALLPEQSGNLVRLTGVKINTLLSGGKDRDGQPGDDLLVALVTPHDEQGELVKIAGDVEIEAYDMTRPGEDKLVGRWTFDPAQSAKVWHSGFVGAGLQFELPWQEAPQSKELLVHARLRTTDGRQFDTSSPLKVVPPQSSAPALLKLPAIQPVKHESERLIDREIKHADFNVPESAPSRPVPFYDEVDPVPTPRPFPGSGTVPAQTPMPKVPGRATLDGIETSDSWTDETIPRLR